MFLRCLRSPSGFHVAGTYHIVGCGSWEEDPTNPLSPIELWEDKNPQPVSRACCCAFILLTSLEHLWFRVRNSGHQGVESSSLGHIPLPSPWVVWLGPAIEMWGLQVSPSWLQAQQMGWHQTWVWLPWQCGVLLVILPLWCGHLGSYIRACRHRCRQTLSITSPISSIFRPFEEVS